MENGHVPLPLIMAYAYSFKATLDYMSLAQDVKGNTTTAHFVHCKALINKQ